MNKIQLSGCGLSCKGVVLLAIFFAIVSGVSAQGPSPAPTGARDANGNVLPPSSTAAATTERVIVTGSNIPTAEEVGPNPVNTYTRDDIQKTGRQTTEQFLLTTPFVGANVIRSEE